MDITTQVASYVDADVIKKRLTITHYHQAGRRNFFSGASPATRTTTKLAILRWFQPYSMCFNQSSNMSPIVDYSLILKPRFIFFLFSIHRRPTYPLFETTTNQLPILRRVDCTQAHPFSSTIRLVLFIFIFATFSLRPPLIFPSYLRH